MTPNRTLVPVLALIGLAALASLRPAPAGAASSDWVETEQTAVRLISASETTGGGPVLLGLQFRMQPGWKIYWRSPGDAGFPPEPDWAGSRNLGSALLSWPAPLRFSVLGLETLGYKDEVVLPVTVEPLVASDGVGLKASIRYLTCNEICIPYEAALALELPSGPLWPSPFTHLINFYLSSVPSDGRAHGLNIDGATVFRQTDHVSLVVNASTSMPFTGPDLYVEGPPELAFSKPVVRLNSDSLGAALEVTVFGTENFNTPVKVLAARELIFTIVDGNRSAERRLRPTSSSSGPVPTAAPAMLTILGLALLGGLILNLMPCVLPVLSLKLLGIVGHGGGERHQVRLSFIASASGILVSFLGLATALVLLKYSGGEIGWGIQFQQPWFLVAMTLLVTLFAYNLWGAFEICLPTAIAKLGENVSHVHGLGGHFLQGVFATLLATPCSAPFLGTAVSFALASGSAEIFLVFTALGLGLALPYLIVAARPGIATQLPRPGPWMVRLRQILGVALAGTGVWLLTVLTTVIGDTGAAVTGLAAITAGGILWLRRRPTAFDAVALVAVAAVAIPAWIPHTNGEATLRQASANAIGSIWNGFDEAAIPRLVNSGKTVFVDVTAEWCITCQINKSFVLARGEVAERLRANSVVAMQADWTRPDKTVSSYLAKFGRYGIPFNIVYGPRMPAGIALPELLTDEAVLDALAAAGNSDTLSSRD